LVKVRQIWQVRKFIHGMKKLKDFKWIGIGYSELQCILHPTHNPLNSRIWSIHFWKLEGCKCNTATLPLMCEIRTTDIQYVSVVEQHRQYSDQATDWATEEWWIDYGAKDFSPSKHPDQLWCPFSNSMGTRCSFPRSSWWGRKLILPLQQCWE
jgi:hypothetical protein